MATSKLDLLGVIFGYAVAVIAVGGAVVATLEFGSALKHAPTVFFCSVILSSWWGGWRSGVFAGLLSTVALDYYFVPPLYALGISIEEAPDMVLFLTSALLVSWLGGERKGGKESLRKVRNKLHAKVRERTSGTVQLKSRLQTEIAKESSIREHADVASMAHIATFAEPATPIVQKPSERAGDVQEAVDESKGRTPAPQKTCAVSPDGARESSAHPPTLCPREESVFLRQGDYWTIHYQGQIARLKATLGLHCLASLLEHPGQEFHVSELVARVAEVPVVAVANLASGASKEDKIQVRTECLPDAGPILDPRAKAEYAQRLAELREELEEAKRFNDPERAARVQQDLEFIADQLAVTVGLGGRNRRAGSQAERARSTVSKRIKHAINKIEQAMPRLGRHLGTRIKTGYFCSYNPNPDRPVGWKVRS